MQRITLSVDDELAAALDRRMKRKRYTSRSEALRDILREAEARETAEARDEQAYCVATLAYVYDHETRDLGRRLTKSQHKHHDLQVATLHVHLDHESCLEVSVLRGQVRSVRALADETVSQRGVRHGQLHLIPATVSHGSHGHGGPRHSHDHLHA
jgi:CopG family nickel-responsive transcriptional regulator